VPDETGTRGRIELIVGLGNPGPEYAATRHNAGSWFLTHLRVALQQEGKFAGRVGRLENAGQNCFVLQPSTFMNRSGQSVAALAGYYRIPATSILVVYDELDLPPGAVRLKRGGGAGGHNGIRDIIAHLGNPGFARLRLGIGHPGVRELVTPYVLSSPPSHERLAIEAAIDAPPLSTSRASWTGTWSRCHVTPQPLHPPETRSQSARTRFSHRSSRTTQPDTDRRAHP